VIASKARFIGIPRGGLDHGGFDEVNALVTTVQPHRRSRLAAIAITLTSVTAVAHVGPSVDDNNRYIALTPLGDRVRLAYTVIFGEVPGATQRAAIDANHDGTISEAEGHAFGVTLAAKVAQALDLELDGAKYSLHWSAIDVSMGTPQVAAGTFAVDLVAYACFAKPRGRHHVLVRDRFAIARPGEVEARVEDAPGITIERARVGTLDDDNHDFRFAGADGPLADDGFDVVLVAGDRSIVAPDADCPAVPDAPGRTPLLVLALAGAAALALASWLFVRARRKRA
jgi:hypothetical protein